MQKFTFNRISLLTIFFLLFASSFGAANHPTYGERGMVVSTSRQASEVGIEILKKGGNAIDAAVATGFALAVTSSSNGNIGGGGFLVARLADGTALTLDFREKAPGKATRDMYLDSLENPIKGASLYTHLSSGVPGSVDGLLKIWRDYGSGKISRHTLLAPAIRLAEKGFALTHYEAERLNRTADLFQKNPAAAQVFIRHDGRPWKAGDVLKQRDLANTLKRIAKDGRNGFYGGRTAALIVAEMERGHGLITSQDLRDYQSKYRPPVTGTFHEYEIISMGPPSSGGALLINMLNMVEPLSTRSDGVEFFHLCPPLDRSRTTGFCRSGRTPGRSRLLVQSPHNVHLKRIRPQTCFRHFHDESHPQ